MLWCCWLGPLACKTVHEMTHNVSSGTLSLCSLIFRSIVHCQSQHRSMCVVGMFAACDTWSSCISARQNEVSGLCSSLQTVQQCSATFTIGHPWFSAWVRFAFIYNLVCIYVCKTSAYYWQKCTKSVLIWNIWFVMFHLREISYPKTNCITAITQRRIG